MPAPHPLNPVRLWGKLEGTSYLLLLGVAMPLKYLAGMPMAVSLVGWVHGILFTMFSFLLLQALIGSKLSFRWAVYTFIAALLPFGPWLIDSRLVQRNPPTS